MAVSRPLTRLRFRLAHLLVPLALLGLLAALFVVAAPERSPRNHYVIDPAAWGSREGTGTGRWIVLGPKGDKTSRIAFDTLWTELRVEDHQAFHRPRAPAGRVQECRTTFETEGLKVTAESCRHGQVRVSARNYLDQPRLVLIEGRVNFSAGPSPAA